MAGNSRLLALRVMALAFWTACVAFLVVPMHSAHTRYQAPGTPQQMPVGARPN